MRWPGRTTGLLALGTTLLAGVYFLLVFLDMLAPGQPEARTGMIILVATVAAYGFVLVVVSNRRHRQAIRRAMRQDDAQTILALIHDGVSRSDLAELFLEAASSGRVRVITALLERGVDVDATAASSLNYTALHCAADAKNLQLAEFLIARGANVNAGDEYGCTPLHHAAEAGSLEMAELLLRHGAEADAEAFPGTPLAVAKANGHESVARLLRTHLGQ